MRIKLAAGSAAVLLAVTLPAMAQATSGKDIDGETGVLHVHGALTTSTCRLEMDSAWQTVDAGTVTTGQLKRPGDAGRPVTVRFRLADCLPVASSARDVRNGNLIWSKDWPSVSMRFSTLTDADAPSLIAVHGASGFGLKLTDTQGRMVRLNEHGAPLLLAPGQNSLKYRLMPVRTLASLYPGAWQALIHVGFSYD